MLLHENRLLGESNDDGVFDEKDLADAFIAGHYVTDAEPASTALSAAIDAADEDAKRAFVA